MQFSVTAQILAAASTFTLAAAQNTYTCPANNDYVVPDVNGVRYVVACGNDTTNGGVSSPAATNSFNDCFALCDAYSGCTAFTYAGPSDAATGGTGGGTCYLKNGNPEDFSGTGNNLVAGIVYGSTYKWYNTATPGFTCPANNNTVVSDFNGTQYTLMCVSATNMGATSSQSVSTSFDDCFPICETISGCTGFTYIGGANGVGTGTCYFNTASSMDFSSTNADAQHVAAIRLANYAGTRPSSTLAYTPGGPALTTYGATSSASSSATSTGSSSTSTAMSSIISRNTASSTTSSTTSPSTTASASYVTTAVPVVTVTTTKGIVVTYTAYYTTVVRKRDMSYETAVVGMY